MSAQEHRHGHGGYERDGHEHAHERRGAGPDAVDPGNGDAVHARFSSRPHPGHVVLELGEELGALIVQTGAELLGVEVEISPAGNDEARSHKEVLERVSGGRSSFVLVFDGLLQGRYTLWHAGRPRNRGVVIRGGEVARVDWRQPARTPAEPAATR